MAYYRISAGDSSYNNATITSGDSVTVMEDGSVNGVTVASGGNLTVRGYAANVNLTGGTLALNSGGSATNVNVTSGIIYTHVQSNTYLTGTNASGSFSISGGVAKNLIVAHLYQTVHSGCSSINTIVSAGCSQIVSAHAVASGTILKGATNTNTLQEVYGLAVGGKVYDDATQILYGTSDGAQAIASDVTLINGMQSVYAGARAYNTRISGGWQDVSGIASGAIVYSGGYQIIDAGGQASNTTVKSGGYHVLWSGGAKSVEAIVEKDGGIYASANTSVSSVTLKAGGYMWIAGGNTLGGTNSFTAASVSGGTASNFVQLAKNASITAGANTKMDNLYLDASNAKLSFNGTGSKLNALKLNSTTVSYNISNLKAKGSTYMLSLTTKNSQNAGKFTVTVARAQEIGVYELSQNIAQNKNLAYSINLNSKKLGEAKLNSTALTKYGLTYSVKLSGQKVNLTIAIKAGKMLKGATKAATLNGTDNSDVFANGKANDTFKGTNGRDVAVYNKDAWGKDTIAKTSGTMTILFNGLKASDIKTSPKNGTMTITRKSDSKQKITVLGWNDATHNIVYASGMNAFNRYLKSAKPTTAQITTARNEAFKKAGLAQA
ncbi:MAG: AIDA repeat-containing protein [Desulfovibrionaceae bacterium]|nr:AIDA repeat-containing protein [Desulfovibrionaceae bacterium]